MSLPAASYHPHRPQDSDYYHCVEDYFETFVQEYDNRFSRQYGFWRPYIKKVIYRYLDCGDLRHGFARVRCKDCGELMPRQSRLDASGMLHHIMIRGIERRKIFLNTTDYEDLLARMAMLCCSGNGDVYQVIGETPGHECAWRRLCR